MRKGFRFRRQLIYFSKLKLHSSKVDTVIMLAGLLFGDSVKYINCTAEMVISHLSYLSDSFISGNENDKRLIFLCLCYVSLGGTFWW